MCVSPLLTITPAIVNITVGKMFDFLHQTPSQIVPRVFLLPVTSTEGF